MSVSLRCTFAAPSQVDDILYLNVSLSDILFVFKCCFAVVAIAIIVATVVVDVVVAVLLLIYCAAMCEST